MKLIFKNKVVLFLILMFALTIFFFTATFVIQSYQMSKANLDIKAYVFFDRLTQIILQITKEDHAYPISIEKALAILLERYPNYQQEVEQYAVEYIKPDKEKKLEDQIMLRMRVPKGYHTVTADGNKTSFVKGSE